MAAFSQLAYLPFEPAQQPPAPGAPKIERDAGRKELAASLSAGEFRLITVFNKDDAQAFLAVRDEQLAVLAFRGTESQSLQDWRIDLNAERVPLPGVRGVTVHRGFLEAFGYCRAENEAAVEANVPSTLGLYTIPWAGLLPKLPRPHLSGTIWRLATPSGRRESERSNSIGR